MRCAALVLAVLWAPQDKTTVEDVLRLMEKNTAALKDLTFEIDSAGEGAEVLGENLTVTAQWRRGTGLRLRVIANPKAKKQAAPGMGLVPQIGGFEAAYAADGLYLWMANEQAGRPLAVSNLRLKWDSPAARAVDPYFIPTGFPIRLLMDDPFIYHEIDPRFFVTREPNVAYEGKRVEGDKTYHILSSYLSPSDLIGKLHGSEMLFTSGRKEFFVLADSGQLARIRWELSMKTNFMGREEEQRMVFLLDAGPRAQVAEGVSLVSSLTWTAFQHKRGRLERERGELIRTFKNFRANTGIAPEAILTGEERADLYADAALLKAEEYEAALKKDPKNVEARYSLAVARGTGSFLEQMMAGMGGGGAKETPKILDDLEKVVEARPEAESAVVNFLAAAEAEGAADRAKPVLLKIEEGVIKGDRVRVLAAGRLNARGEHDRALALLEKAPATESLRRRAALERLFALASRKDGAALAAGFEAEAARRATTADKVALIREIEPRVASLPKGAWSAEAAEKLIAAAIEKAPGEIAWRLALARIRGTPEAVAALVEAAPADEAAVDFAIELLSERTEFKGEEAQRLRAAMAKVTTGDPRVPYEVGRAFKASGAADEAKKEFGSALERCLAMKKGEPNAAYAGATLFELAEEDAGDEWLEKIVAAIVKVAPDGEGIPRTAMWDEGKNPVAKLAGKHIDAKRWLDFYRLATDAEQLMRMSTWQIRQRLQETGRQECAKALQEELLRAAKDAGPHKKYAEFAEEYLGDEGSIEVLEKARELAPKDVEVLWLLGQVCVRKNERERAIAAFEAVIPLLETPATVGHRTVAREDALVELAQRYSDPLKVKETLAKIDLKAPGTEGSTAVQVGDEYARVEEFDLAIAAYLRGRELGLRPYFKLGRMLEKKKEYYEAIRWYNRDIAEGSSRDSEEGQVIVEPPRMGGEGPGAKLTEEEPKTGKEAREKLLKKLGPDFLIGKFLEQKFDPLTPEEEGALKRAVEGFRSDSMEEREAAEADVRRIGPRAAPHLKDLLRAGDEEVKTRARVILSGWADPR